jgi:glycerate kinase
MRIPFELVFVTDVNNPLLGENGATRIYGSQKGIKPDEYELFDNFFLKILNLSKKNLTNIELSGAGGGIPAGISLFYDVSVMSSKEFIIGELEVDKRLNPDVIITGEGAIDEQTFMEKGIGVLLNEYPQKKFFIITGKSNIDMMKSNVKIIELSRFYTSIEESIADYESGIQTACKEIADDILFDRKVN